MYGMNEFDPQKTATQYWDEQGPAFLFNAAVAMQKTSEPLAGLMVEKGAPEYSTLKPILVETKSQSGKRLLIGILDRAPVMGILALQGKQDIVEWIDEQAPPFSRSIAVFIITAEGMEARVERVPNLRPKAKR